SPRGFAPRTPLHALSRAASPARSDRVAHSLRSFASAFDTPSIFLRSGRIVEVLQQPLRDPIEREANQRVAQGGKRDPEIAVARQLRIERHRAEAGNAQARIARFEERLDRVAVAAVVAAHVLDVAED